MNQWYFDIGIMILLSAMIIGLIIGAILLMIGKIRKNKGKVIGIFCVVDFIFIGLTILFMASHSTYYKYNDWAILQNDIYSVKEKYGEFDFGKISENRKGTVAYYIYTDNGPIMPDHLEHYYYIEYDEKGIVYNVYNGCQMGG